jgi:integrase
MAYLKKRGNRSYWLKWYENGQQQTMSFKADTEEEAQQFKEKKEKEIERIKSSQLRLNDIWDFYKKNNPRRNNKPHEEAYWKRVNEYYDNCLVSDITANSVNNFKSWLVVQPNKNFKNGKKETLSSTYSAKVLKVLKTVLKFSDDNEIIEIKNPFKNFKFPIEQKRDIVLTWDEVSKLYETALSINELEAEYLMFLVATGLRREELYKLRWEDIRENQIILRLTKTGKNEIIPLWSQFREILDKIKELQPKKTEYVYTDKDGKRYNYPEAITDMARRYFIRLGIYKKGMGAHTFRHSFTTLALENGMSTEEVSIILRHSSLKMTERYTHLIPNEETGKKADFISGIKEYVSEKEKIFPKWELEELAEAGILTSDNPNIIRIKLHGRFWFLTPCGEGFKTSPEAEEHFENCFKCQKYAEK